MKYTWKDNPVLTLKKKGKGKVQIQMKDETKIINLSELSELKKTEDIAWCKWGIEELYQEELL